VNAFALPGGFFYVNKGLILPRITTRRWPASWLMRSGMWLHVTRLKTKPKALCLNTPLWPARLPGRMASLIYQNTAAGWGCGGIHEVQPQREEEADRLGVQYMYAPDTIRMPWRRCLKSWKRRKEKAWPDIQSFGPSHPRHRNGERPHLPWGKIPEREEYVISSSEFQRAKGRLLRLSNARASSAGELPGGDNGAPVALRLKRRQPHLMTRHAGRRTAVSRRLKSRAHRQFKATSDAKSQPHSRP